MKRFLLIGLVILAAAPALSATSEDEGRDAQYIWVHETSVQSQFKFQMGVGSLNSEGLTGSRGVVITNFLGADFAATRDTGISLGLPLAGTISGGPDNYGIGNIMFGGKYVMPLDRIRLAVGMDLALPTAQNRAAVGLSTPRYTQFVKDQFAASPYVALSFVGDQLTATVDAQPDIQIFTTKPVGFDRTELVLSYDGALAYSIYENFWVTTEFGGHSSLTYPANHTAFFGGAGVRFQDHEISLGGHIWAPFRDPEKKNIDLVLLFDLRVLF